MENNDDIFLKLILTSMFTSVVVVNNYQWLSREHINKKREMKRKLKKRIFYFSYY